MWVSNKGKLALGILALVSIIALGFLRDFLFININYIIDRLYYNLEVYYYHSFYSFLEPWEVGGLMKLKWGLTLVFMFLNLGLSVLILKNLFAKPRLPLRMLYGGYVLLFLVSGFFYLIGNAGGLPELGYTLARRFMGVLQSPVPLMFAAILHVLFQGAKQEGN